MASIKRIIYIFSALLVCVPIIIEAGNTGLNGYNQQLFRPQTDGYGLYNVSGSKVLPHLKYSLGLYTNLSKNSMSVEMPARLSSIDLIDSNLTGDLSAALGFFDLIDVGVNIPVALYEKGTNYDDLQTYSTSALGDIRIDLKFRLLEDKADSIGMALMSVASFPTGNRYTFTGDDGLTWEGRLVLDKTVQRLSLFLNSGYRFVRSQLILSTELDDRITFGGGASFKLPFDGDRWFLLAELSGETMARDIKKTTTPVEIWGGIRRKFDSGLVLNVGGGRRLFDAIGASDLRVLAGVSFDMATRDERKEIKIALVNKNNVDLGQYTINFVFGSFDPDRNEYQKLKELGTILLNNKDIKVTLQGHTDNVGPSYFNMMLSKKRAESVKEALIGLGVLPCQISIRSFGEELPVASNGSRDGRAKNRRVEIRR